MTRKLQGAAYWAIPSILCLIVYWPGLLTWFQQDDFVWLNLPNQVFGPRTLLSALFHPTVHGTWRPLSERAFFLAFGAMFGSAALPYRIWVFLTQFANLVLLASITRRLTGSRAAGFCAAIFWISNACLATIMSWTCEYILVACGFCLLLALHFFLRYTETGDRRFYRRMWITFLAGFLAMETNVVFPLLAGSYALLRARKYFRATLPLFGVSAAYAALHVLLAPSHGAQPYTIHLDTALPATLWTYWRLVFEPVNLDKFTPFPTVAGTAEMAACTVALAVFTFYRARRKDWLPVIFLMWFVALLLPVLPLRFHISDYHLTLPTLAVSMLAAYAFVCAWRAGIGTRLIAAVLACAFLAMSMPVARRATDWFRRRSQRQEALVMGVAHAHQLHPNKTILLDGVNDDLFWGAITQRPFLYLGIDHVYLTPGSETAITAHPELSGISNFILPADQTRDGLAKGDIVVYSAAHWPLKNITQEYQAPAARQQGPGPLRLDVADPMAADRLGPTWYAVESGFRWMPREASVHLGGPQSAAQKLYVSAVCPALQLDRGPLEMTVSINGRRLAPVRFTKANQETTFAFPLPAETIGQNEIAVTVEVARTVRAGGDQRDLGLAFGRFEIK